ncbi:hypothetical protein [Cryobacterium roopkundense]|uniref:DNA-binding IscR family transcriptional regulator n=1 Tax=Cryobacterium roopkundense TaxID=1001240 RepID=A0A7W9A0M5_9MICO|nr:DNA-binding IscR family transcriptional regulator [Cryobacterium roopkundense]
MSASAWTPWDLSRRLSPRDQVRVMKRDAYGRLDENSYPLIYRVGPTEPTTPWLVRLADDAGIFRLLCFDFDGKEAGVVSPDLMERAVDDCDALSGLLDRLAIAHVVCQSSGTGGRHIWVALHGGAPAAVVAALAGAAHANYSTLDHGMLCNPREGGARPPLAPHRDGSSSTILRGAVEDLLSPTATSTDLDTLTRVLDQAKPASRPSDTTPSGPIDARYSAHRPLSAWGQGHMATVNGGSNPSWTGFMCLLAAASAGWTLADASQEARTAPGMEHYRTKNMSRGARKPRTEAEATARLERQWAKAQQYSALQAPLGSSRTPADLAELGVIVDTVDDLLTRFRASPGRWGQSEAATSRRTILSAVAYLTLQTGKRTVAASIRDLALMVGLSRDTARRALTALAEDGFLVRVSLSDSGNAAEWRLSTDFSTASRTVASQPLNNPRPPSELFNLRTSLVTNLERQLTDGRHDLFTRPGLGHLAGKVYALLAQHPALTLETAARLLGVSTRHIATIFSRLRHHRLIVKHVDGWARAKRDLRDLAARIVGVAGLLLDRANRYRAEREVWEWWQAEVATMNAAPRRRPRRVDVSSRPLFRDVNAPGERVWPRYPRSSDQRGDHRSARELVDLGVLNPENRWQYLGDAA